MIDHAKHYPANELEVGDFVFSNLGVPSKITKIEGNLFTYDYGGTVKNVGEVFAYKPPRSSKLTQLDENVINFLSSQTGKHLGTDDQVCRFVEKYEQDPDRFTGSNQKIRYEANKRGFTLGELEAVLGLSSGTISNASQNRNERTDAILSLFFGIPQDELRTVPTGTPTSRTAKIKKIVALMRNLANELETI